MDKIADESYPGAGGVIVGITSHVMDDVGSQIIDEANKQIAQRIVVELDKQYTNIIDDNGKLNRDELSHVTSGSLNFLFSPGFQNEVGAPELIAQLQGKVTADQLSEVLKDTNQIKLNASQLNARIKALNATVIAAKNTQKILLSHTEASKQTLDVLNTQLGRQQELFEAYLKSNMPKAQVLALINSGALSVSSEEKQKYDKDVLLENMKVDLDGVSKKFSALSDTLSNLGLKDVAVATSLTSSLVSNGGAFAVAWASNNPLAIAQSGAGLFASVKAFGYRPRPSAEMQMLSRALEEIHALSIKIDKYHAEEMQILQSIYSKLDDIDNRLQREFGSLFFDIALLQRDVRELLSDSVYKCGRLVEEYATSEKLHTMGDGFKSFASWFQSDGRNIDYLSCLDGLTSRLEVKSETNFSGLLRAEMATEGQSGDSIKQRREEVRKLEEQVIWPTVDYTSKYSTAKDSHERLNLLYTPQSSICDVYKYSGEQPSRLCNRYKSVAWAPTKLVVSEFNPGGGALISPDATLELARFARILAPWNTALTETSNGIYPRVITRDEAFQLTIQKGSQRTRHLYMLRNAINALDLSIAQAQLLAGIPVIINAVKILEDQILPSYARARLLNDSVEINKILAVKLPNGKTRVDCSTGNAPYDTLCLMQTNRWFASNVIATLLMRRIERSGLSYDDWRRTASLPFSPDVSKIMGPDILLINAAPSSKEMEFNTWAIELPRVNTTLYETKESASDCWTLGKVPNIDNNSNFYRNQNSSMCYILPHYTTIDFNLLTFPYGYEAMLGERYSLIEELAELCDGLNVRQFELCDNLKQN